MHTVEDVINTVKSRMSCGSSVSPSVPSLRNEAECQLQQLSLQCTWTPLLIRLQRNSTARSVRYAISSRDCVSSVLSSA